MSFLANQHFSWQQTWLWIIITLVHILSNHFVISERCSFVRWWSVNLVSVAEVQLCRVRKVKVSVMWACFDHKWCRPGDATCTNHYINDAWNDVHQNLLLRDYQVHVDHASPAHRPDSATSHCIITAGLYPRYKVLLLLKKIFKSTCRNNKVWSTEIWNSLFVC